MIAYTDTRMITIDKRIFFIVFGFDYGMGVICTEISSLGSNTNSEDNCWVSKRSEERDNILRLTGCTEVRNKSKAGDLRQYSEDLMRLFGRYSFSIFLASYLFHRFGDDLEWKDTAAANLLRLRESEGIEELQKALKDLFPHVDDKLIWNAMIDEKFDGISSAERILSLSTDSQDESDKYVSDKSKKVIPPTSLFRVPRVALILSSRTSSIFVLFLRLPVFFLLLL